MATVFDYITWRGDLSFSQSPLCEVDNLILSRLSYFPMDGIVSESFDESVQIRDAAETFFQRGETGENIPVFQEEDIPFIKALAGSERFGPLRISAYKNHVDINAQKQFSCLSVMLDEERAFISYRGTDNTLVGWKEDFNMSFMPVVPAQQDALRYFESAADVLDTGFYLGGHSKGGNLAVYSAAFCREDLKPRILGVFNNDGPGFHESMLSDERYQAVRDKVQTYVPQASVIGMLFEHEENYTVIKSVGRGLLQHNLYSWDIVGTSFTHLDSVDSSSRFLNHTLKEWIEHLSLREREQFADALYGILSATEASTFEELDANWLKSAQSIIDTYGKTDKSTKRLLEEALKSLIQIGGKNIRLFGGLSKK